MEILPRGAPRGRDPLRRRGRNLQHRGPGAPGGGPLPARRPGAPRGACTPTSWWSRNTPTPTCSARSRSRESAGTAWRDSSPWPGFASPSCPWAGSWARRRRRRPWSRSTTRVSRRSRRLLEGAKRPRVLYWANPYTAGAHSAIGAIIEGAGAENVGRTLGLEGIAPLGGERAFVADPDVVLVGASFESVESLRQHPLLGKLRAVREGHVVEMPGELLVTLSQYAAQSCWFLASKLHPGRVSADGWKAVGAAPAAAREGPPVDPPRPHLHEDRRHRGHAARGGPEGPQGLAAHRSLRDGGRAFVGARDRAHPARGEGRARGALPFWPPSCAGSRTSSSTSAATSRPGPRTCTPASR